MSGKNDRNTRKRGGGEDGEETRGYKRVERMEEETRGYKRVERMKRMKRRERMAFL